MAAAEHTIHVDIVSAEGEIFSGAAKMVFVPASQGDIGIAPRHAPLLTLLKAGEVRVRTPDGPGAVLLRRRRRARDPAEEGLHRCSPTRRHAPRTSTRPRRSP
ncbi:MAG: hypothetical protein U1F11_09065 [Steroidobacteraceae bacterium]